MSGQRPLIDVIVPVYNVESYLPKCMESLLAQDYERFAVTLIDDGSTDGSGALCDAYAAKDSRVRALHQANTGQATARNRAVARSDAALITFVDADDWLSPGYLSALYGAMERTGAGMASARICAETVRSDGSLTPALYPLPEQSLMERDQALAALCREGVSGVSGFLCGKLTARENVLAHPFPEGRLFEDSFAIWRQVMDCGKLVCVPEAVYHFLIRGGSTQHKPFEPRHMDLLDAAAEMMGAFRSAGMSPEVMAAGAYKVCRSCYVTAFHAADLPYARFRDVYRHRVRPLLARYMPALGRDPAVRWKERALFLLLRAGGAPFYALVRLSCRRRKP